MGFLNSIVSFFAKVVGVIIIVVSAFFGMLSARISVYEPAPVPVMQTISPITSTTPTQQKLPEKSLAPSSARSEDFLKGVSAKPLVQVAAKSVENQTFVSQPLATLSPDALNTMARGALVNILCTTGTGGSFKPISGSGVIIDNRGIILTNAHVGQFFLLRDYPTPNNIDCLIRTGSPAAAHYRAELLYLPPAWISANASQIISAEPTGTGENDYAFLRITGTSDASLSLPTFFSNLAMSTQPPSVGDQTLLAAYPAGFLDGTTIQMNLYPSSALASVQKLYSFNSIDIDLFSIGGTIVSQSGSSGGAVVRAADGALIGIITTDTAGTTTASRELNAITLGHIDRSLRAQGISGIATLLSGDSAAAARLFNDQIAPLEKQKLLDILKKTQP